MSTIQQKKPKRLRWLLRTIITLIVLGAVAYLIMYGFARSAQARWEMLAAKLREAGQPLTYAELQPTRPEIPEGENGAIVFRSAIEMLADVPESTPKDVLWFDPACGFYIIDGISRACLPPTRRYVDERRHCLDRLAESETFEKFSITPPLFGLDGEASDGFSKFLSGYRKLTKLQYLDFLLSTVDGEYEEAVDRIAAQLRLNSRLYQEPNSVVLLVVMANDNLTISSIESLLAVGELPDHLLERIGQVLARWSGAVTIRPALLGQRVSFIQTEDMLAQTDSIRAIRQRVGQVMRQRQNVPLEELDLPPRILHRSPYGEWIQYENRIRGALAMTRLLDASDEWPLLLNVARAELSTAQDGGHGAVFAEMILSMISREAELHAQLLAASRCAIAATAAERYRMAHGEFPRDLNELATEYREGVPLDPFDGNLLRLAQTDEGIIIYSVGQNQVDDGGVLTRIAGRNSPLDVGFRLLRPEHRGIRFIDE